MASTRIVRVERNRLRFAAAHMATFGGDCEPLHGHNYDVMVEVEGSLTEESWVIEFLLQERSQHLISEQRDGLWLVRFGADRHYQFPAQDVIALPIDNSTAERLAEWIHAGITVGLKSHRASNIIRLGVGVEEMPGQSGWYQAPV
jgi:6-pyruvoyltetrahydropterin/6-carboxytetrahydropterin synthase